MALYLRLLFIVCLLPVLGKAQDKENIVTPEDFQVMHGEWQGRLTYVDYTSGNPFSMPAKVTIEEGKSDLALVLDTKYPNEPKANNKSKISIS